MSLSPAVLDAMLAAGCTADQIVAAVKASLGEQEAKDADRRAKDAERQRKHRARHAVSRDVTVTDRDSFTEAPLSLSPNENNSNPHTHTPGDITPARKGPKFPCPEGVDPDDWDGLLESRKGQRAPMTDRAYVKICSKLKTLEREGWPPGPLVATAVERGWRTVFKPTEHIGTRNDRPASNDQAPRNPYVRAVIARQASRSGDERGQSGGWPERGTAAF